MSLPELVQQHTDPCGLSDRWGISIRLAEALVRMTRALQDVPFSIISGSRSPAHQDALRRAGRPAADNDRSTHLSCPATGVDLNPTVFPVNVVKARLGAEGTLAGLRWGGGSPNDPRTGIPSDWRHFDLGPRAG